MAESPFPSNTEKDRVVPAKTDRPAAEEPRVEKVIDGRVTRQKKSFWRRTKEFFRPQEDIRVGEYIVFDILIPSFKDMVVDSVTSGLERKFYGEVRPHYRRPSSRYGGGHTPYHQMSKSPSSRRTEQHGMTRRGRQTHDFDELVFESRVQADEVLAQMENLIQRYEVASVSDLLHLAGEQPSYVDKKWGWVDLYGASTQRVRGGGYLLNLPRPEPID